MRIDWLDDIVALLDTGSVLEAARLRNISQSAFSRRIQGLEDVLRVSLVERRTKPSRPSATLRAHEDKLRRLALELRQLLKEMHHESRTGSKLVVIASQHAITTSLGPEIINALSGLGKTHIRLRSANLDECQGLLLTGQADFSLTYRLSGEPQLAPGSLTEELVVTTEKLIPVFRSADADALLEGMDGGQLDIVAYPADAFLGLAVGQHILPNLERLCSLNEVAETALSPAALQLSRAGVGVAWIPSALGRADLASGDLVDLSDALGALDMQLIATRRRDTTNPLDESIWANLQSLAI